jgi:branched-chain amino acid transport system permease protein
MLGAYLVWALWSLSGGVLRGLVPVDQQARAAALQVVLIGVLLAAILLVRPRGLIGEEAVVSRHAGQDSAESA